MNFPQDLTSCNGGAEPEEKTVDLQDVLDNAKKNQKWKNGRNDKKTTKR